MDTLSRPLARRSENRLIWLPEPDPSGRWSFVVSGYGTFADGEHPIIQFVRADGSRSSGNTVDGSIFRCTRLPCAAADRVVLSPGVNGARFHSVTPFYQAGKLAGYAAAGQRPGPGAVTPDCREGPLPVDANGNPIQSAGGVHGYLVLFDLNGTPTRAQGCHGLSRAAPLTETFNRIVATNDGKLALAGHTQFAPAGAVPTFRWMFVLTPDLQIVGNNAPSTDASDVLDTHLTRTGDYLFAFTLDIGDGRRLSGMTPGFINSLGFFPDARAPWGTAAPPPFSNSGRVFFGGHAKSAGRGATDTADGAFVLAGEINSRYTDAILTDASQVTENTPHGFMVKAAASGSPIWVRSLGDKPNGEHVVDSSLNDVVETPSGDGYVAVGYRRLCDTTGICVKRPFAIKLTAEGAIPPSCADGIQNQGETQIDCGGPRCTECCSNHRLDPGEEKVDCGGTCAACCGNNRIDPGENDIDCGGSCVACCSDGRLDFGEQQIDCGGPNCTACCSNGRPDPGELSPDCGGTCPPCCSNGRLDPGESKIDCGGPCPPCIPTQADVEFILNQGGCTNCHTGPHPEGSMDLNDIRAVIDTDAVGCPSKKRIICGDADHSYLVDKVKGEAQQEGTCFSGTRMPTNREDDPAVIVAWINANCPP